MLQLWLVNVFIWPQLLRQEWTGYTKECNKRFEDLNSTCTVLSDQRQSAGKSSFCFPEAPTDPTLQASRLPEHPIPKTRATRAPAGHRKLLAGVVRALADARRRAQAGLWDPPACRPQASRINAALQGSCTSATLVSRGCSPPVRAGVIALRLVKLAAVQATQRQFPQLTSLDMLGCVAHTKSFASAEARHLLTWQ